MRAFVCVRMRVCVCVCVCVFAYVSLLPYTSSSISTRGVALTTHLTDRSARRQAERLVGNLLNDMAKEFAVTWREVLDRLLGPRERRKFEKENAGLVGRAVVCRRNTGLVRNGGWSPRERPLWRHRCGHRKKGQGGPMETKTAGRRFGEAVFVFESFLRLSSLWWSQNVKC